MAVPPLTPGAISALMETVGKVGTPLVVQVQDIKRIAPVSGGAERWRLMISDGVYHVVGMLASHLGPMVTENRMMALSVIEILDYTISTVASRKVVVVNNLRPLAVAPAKIGSSVSYPAPEASAAAAPTSSAGEPSAPGGAGMAAAVAPSKPAFSAPPMGGGMGGGGMTTGAAMGMVGGPMSRGPTGPTIRAADAMTGFGARAGAGSAPGGRPSHVMPIAALNQFTAAGWCIKARVSSKDSVREWNNARGSGKLFSVTLLDESNVDIRATFFQGGVDLYVDKIEVGKVYIFGNGKVKPANKAYNSCKSEFEINFDDKTVVTPVEDDARIKRAHFNFVPVARIEAVEAGTVVDVCGIAVSVGTVAQLMSKSTGKELMKRDVTLGDMSGASITLTLWGEKTALEISPGNVVCAKMVKVGDFGGRSLSTLASSIVLINPEGVPQAETLLGWYTSGAAGSFRTLTEGRGGGGSGGDGGSSGPLSFPEMRYTVESCKDEGGPEVKIVKASIFNIRHDDPKRLMYPACQNTRENRACQKKMTETEAGRFTCEMCGEAPMKWRYILNAQIGDHAGTEYTTFFDGEASQLLGVPADALHGLAAETAGGQGSPEYERVFSHVLYRELLLTTKVKLDDRAGGEARLRINVVKMREVEPAKEARALLHAITRYERELMGGGSGAGAAAAAGHAAPVSALGMGGFAASSASYM